MFWKSKKLLDLLVRQKIYIETTLVLLCLKSLCLEVERLCFHIIYFSKMKIPRDYGGFKFTTCMTRPFGSGGGGAGGGFSPPNNLLKFVDFVSEKGCKSQCRRNEDSNSYVFVEATRIHQICNIF